MNNKNQYEEKCDTTQIKEEEARNIERVETISIEEAAKILGKGPQFVRIGLQKERFPFGGAIPPTEGRNRWNYIIFKNKFLEYIGKKGENDEINESTESN